VDRVQADDLAREMEAEHVLAPGLVDHVGLDRAGAHRGDRLERVALAEQVLAGLERADVVDQHVQVAQRGLVQAFGQASLRKRAGGAEGEFVAVVGDDPVVDPRELDPGLGDGVDAAHAAPRWVRWRANTGARKATRSRRAVRPDAGLPGPGNGRSTSQCYATAAARATSPRSGRARTAPGLRPPAAGACPRPRRNSCRSRCRGAVPAPRPGFRPGTSGPGSGPRAAGRRG